MAPEFEVLRTDHIHFLIIFSNLVNNAAIDGIFEGVLTGDDLIFSGLFEDQFEILAEQFEFSEDAGGDLEDGLAVGGVLELSFEVEIAFDHDLDEIAVEQQLVGIVELVVDAIEIYDLVHLLIVHL